MAENAYLDGAGVAQLWDATKDYVASHAAQPEVTSGTEDEAAWLTRETAAGFPCGGRATVRSIKGHSEVVDGSLVSAKPTGIESTGKNLIHSATDRNVSTNGITRIYLADANLLRVYGTATANNQDVSITLDKPITVLAGESLTFSLDGFVSAGGSITCYAKVGSAYPEYRAMNASNGYQCTFTDLGGSTVEAFMLRFNTSTGAVNIDALPQVEYGTTATEYEPYWSQAVSIPASTYFPNGMNGVSSASGESCDELTADAAITRTITVVIDGVNVKATGRTSHGDNNRYLIPMAGANAPRYRSFNTRCESTPVDCDYDAAIGGTIATTEKDALCPYTDAIYYTSSSSGSACTTLEQMNAWFAEHPVTVCYELATPTTQAIDPPIPMTYRTEAGGTETVTHTEATSASTLDVVYEIDGTAAAASIAPLEGRTASTNYSLGALLMLGGTLVKVTTAIATGEQIILGQNVEATTVAAELAALA